MVDGKGARFFNDVRLLAGNTDATGQTTAFEAIGAFMSAATIDAVFTYLAGIRASAHFPVATSDNDHILTVKTGTAPPRLIVPVWRRGQLLRDTGRLQLSGDVTLTGVMYADVIIAATDLHDDLFVKTQTLGVGQNG